MSATTLCPRCSTPLPDSARFCPGCGATTPTGFIPATGQPEELSKRESDLSARRAEVERALGAGWEVRSLIGAGGFGEVWAAWDTRLKRDVAIKTLRSDIVASESMMTRFQREAEAVARLRHPNIVPIYQVGESNGLAYFIMPLVRGESLHDLLKRDGKLPIEDARRIIAESASALDAAHKAGIVHRDIKPENIMLEGDERRVLLMDFGIARALGSDEGRLTGTGLVVGTPQYMSPEQASADKTVDHRSDIYSLGVVAYQMLAGRLPFDSSSARELVVHHIATEPDDLRALRADVPDDVYEAVMKCLRKAPELRFASAGELASAVRPVTAPVRVPSALGRTWRRLTSARTTRYRIAAYLIVFAIAAVVLANVDADRLSAQLYQWQTRRGRQVVEVDPNVVPEFRRIWDFRAGTRYRSQDVQLASWSDSVLFVSSPVGSPMLFDGTTWRGLDLPSANWVFPPAVLNDSVWIAADGAFPGMSILYLLTAAGALPLDTLRHRIRAVWSDGKTILLGAEDGAMLRGRPGRWRSEPTGRAQAITQLWGDSARQFGILDGRLLSFNGMNWRRVEPSGDSTTDVDVGTTLGDGTSAVVAESRVYLRNRSGDRWTDAELSGLPKKMDLYGIWGASPDDYYVYGAAAEPACASIPCLYHVQNGTAKTIAGVHGDFHVIGIASLRGAPYVLASSGAVWTERNGEWGAVSEVPSSILRGIVVTRPTIIAWGRGLLARTEFRSFAPSQRPDLRRVVIATDVSRATQTIFILTDAGVISRIDCRMATKDCREEREVAPPDRRRVLDIEVDGDNRLRIAGQRGLLAVANGEGWTISGGTDPREDIVSVSARRGTPAFALTPRRILAATPSGTFKTWQELSPSVGRARQVIGSPDGGAVVLGEGGAFAIFADGTSHAMDFCVSLPTSIEVLDDARILVGCASPGDPLAGGQLFVVRPHSRGLRQSKVPLPQAMDVYGIGRLGEIVHIVGSGGFWLTTQDSRLPYADFARVYVGSDVRDAELFIPSLNTTKTTLDVTVGHLVPKSELRLVLRKGNCTIWDSTVDLRNENQLRLGVRNGSCK